ncbi:hypothetical protein BH11PAT2_BH11PAT2_05570 [soil metagenome]
MFRSHHLPFACVLALAACSSPPATKSEPREASAATSQAIPVAVTLPAIDYSNIVTFDDYDKVRQKAFENYEQAKNGAFARYEQARTAAFNTYYTYEHQELAKVRAGDAKSYLAWLDAKERDDFEAVLSLEQSSPLLKTYQKNDAVAYISYEVANKKAYDAYQAIDIRLYGQYQDQDSHAYAAYQAHKKP